MLFEDELWPHPFTPIGTAAAALTTHILLTDRYVRLASSHSPPLTLVAAFGVSPGVKSCMSALYSLLSSRFVLA